jgi:hypothetical protein
MAERNRVLPDSSIVAVPARGAWMGNRGCLHNGHEIVRPWRLRAWLVCRLSFRGRHVAQWAPGRYTPLFFLDEAVAFAAGHRPCGECRHHDYLAYRDAAGAASAGELDARLHAERRAGPARVPWRDLPDGAFALSADGPALVLGDRLVRWDDQAYAYGAAAPRPRAGSVEVLTPPTTLDVLRHGVPVQVHDTARLHRKER